MRDAFNNYKITTREPSFLLNNSDEEARIKAQSSSEI